MGRMQQSIDDSGEPIATIRGNMGYYELTSEGMQQMVELHEVHMLLYDGWVHVKDMKSDMWLPRERIEFIFPK